jgi:hypothetical protein
MNDMPSDNRKHACREDWFLASMLEMAQTTQPLKASPPVQNNAPADSKPGRERPTTPAPEPARPDPDAQKAGATPRCRPRPLKKSRRRSRVNRRLRDRF